MRNCRSITRDNRYRFCRTKNEVIRRKCRRSCCLCPFQDCVDELDSDLQMTQHEDEMMEDDALVDEMMDDALVDEMDYVLVNETMEDALVEE